jgi:hypothetical protein
VIFTRRFDLVGRSWLAVKSLAELFIDARRETQPWSLREVILWTIKSLRAGYAARLLTLTTAKQMNTACLSTSRATSPGSSSSRISLNRQTLGENSPIDDDLLLPFLNLWDWSEATWQRFHGIEISRPPLMPTAVAWQA